MKRVFGFGDEDDSPAPPPKRPKLFDDDFGAKKEEPIKQEAAADEEVDPLDAFMTGIQQELVVIKNQTPSAGPKILRADLEEEDPTESFLKHRNKQRIEEEKKASNNQFNEEDLEYDSDDNPIIKKKEIEPLPPIDHAKMKYDDFEKNFYDESEEIANMTEDEVAHYRTSLGIKVHGVDTIRPIKTFAHFGFDEALMKKIKEAGFDEPTPIQKQAVPTGLAGRDIIGIAKTGSGKTAAFVWPMLVHIMDQPEVEKGEGPVGVIVAPTRELAQQIYVEAGRFAKAYGIKVAAVFGGSSRGDQFKLLRNGGCEIIVCTPGRLIDMIKLKATKMNRVSFLVLDEADRMFDMGFEPQIRSIVGQIRPDRQTLLFSATFKPAIEALAIDILTNPIRITVGNVGMANEDVTQIVEVMDTDEQKWPWLVERLYDFMKEGSVLVFVSTKTSAEELQVRLNNIPDYAGKVAAIHGDKTQNERTKIMHAFKSGGLSVLVATDVAARGLDIKSIKTVVNYFMPRDIDSYVHRIGRTGRAGDKTGVAYALLTRKETFFAGELVKVLEGANQRVTPDLINLAMQNNQFRKQRTGKYQGRRAGPGRGRGRGGRGGGGGGRGGGLNPLQPRQVAGIGYDTKTNANPSNNNEGPGIMASLNQAIIRDIMTKMPLPTDDYSPDEPTEEYDPSEPTDEVSKQPTYSYTPLTSVNRAQVFKEAMNSRFKSSFVKSNDDEDKKWASNYQPPRK
eukprot:TRINITY_DN6063_c0_g1_i1.p1 TRINITY_DN6063_c0_g1~~TRINITY_DN6063_c0_g1_i1.p1  ORF type:complete len:733 (-),score=208.78 TRINITY_DN6063_c0_g1_i1:12-2210(-)